MSNLEERLEDLRNAIKEATDKVKALKDERRAITDAVKAEERSVLTEEETAQVRAKTAEIKRAEENILAMAEEVKDLEAEIERAGKLNEAAQHAARAAQVQVTKEPLTYEHRNGVSYFQDFLRKQIGQADDATEERLRRHAQEVASAPEFRNLDRSDGSGGYFVPPAWMMSRFVELARASRAYANLCPTEVLPRGTDSINIPKVASGAATAIQTADNDTVAEVDLTDTSVRADVKTIAGQQGVAIQLLDQSPVNFDEVIFRDLTADYATKLDLQVISGTGTGNQVTGVRSTAGISTITASATGDGPLADTRLVYAKIADAVQRVHTNRFLPAEVIVMHPRRWAAFMAAFDGDSRPLIAPSGAGVNQVGVLEAVASQQVVGQMHGLPVVTDPNMPTTLGAGTNEDVIHVLRASDLLLFESGIRTRALEQTRAEGLTVLLQVYGYLAFTAGRYPQSVVEIGGSALATPTFTGAIS